ncbi:MAG: hypothetical protein LBJ90_05750 [Treponema sp.]|jgi:hypothetical protein|nr:hypothetical protein [Treponema sp.]
MKHILPIFIAAASLTFASCDLFEYGQLGGADKTYRLAPGDDGFEERMSFMSGVWYSHYAGIGRLDGYRIGKWEDFDELVAGSGKTALFPGFDTSNPKTYSTDETPENNDYFVLYDDTVYGQGNDGAGGNGGWSDLVSRYIGIVRAVNVFNGDPDRGVVIVEYLKGCAPTWDDDIKDGRRPFFGIYYRVLKPDIVQMANAVDLAALYNGEKYYTETKTLDEAVALNTVENEAEFIAWGVVIPQDREE